MSKVVHTGSWFLPNSNKKYPGQVVVNDKSITLEIFSDESIEGAKVTNLLKAELSSYHPIILGVVNGLITLYNCHWAGTEPVGDGLAKTTYEAAYSFIGGHITDENEMNVKSGTFSFPDVVSWFDGWKSHDKIPLVDKTGGEYSGIKVNQSKEETIEVNENLSIYLTDRFDKEYHNLGFHHSIKYKKLIHFFYKSPVHFKKMIEDAATFRRLLEFSYGKPIVYKIFEVGIPKTNIEQAGEKLYPNGDYVRIHVGNFTLNKGRKIEQSSRHQNHMLVSSWNTKKEDLTRMIRAWFSNREYFSIYDYYLDSNNWFQDSDAIISNVMFNNRFLNLVQGLEAYYNKTSKKDLKRSESFNTKKEAVLRLITDKELNKWTSDNLLHAPINLKEKLSWIINEFLEEIKKVFYENPLVGEFPDYAKKIRNLLSHGRNKETSLGVELRYNFFIGRIILAACILKSLGVQDIAAKISHFDEFNRNLYEIDLVARERDTK